TVPNALQCQPRKRRDYLSEPCVRRTKTVLHERREKRTQCLRGHFRDGYHLSPQGHLCSTSSRSGRLYPNRASLTTNVLRKHRWARPGVTDEALTRRLVGVSLWFERAENLAIQVNRLRYRSLPLKPVRTAGQYSASVCDKLKRGPIRDGDRCPLDPHPTRPLPFVQTFVDALSCGSDDVAQFTLGHLNPFARPAQRFHIDHTNTTFG